MAKVILDNIYKSYGATAKVTPPKSEKAGQTPPAAVLRAINLTIHDGEFMVLVGPSGCGKSTLLRLIAGLEDITGGDIYVGDRRVNDLAPKARDIAMVFQNYALYPHMSVYENLAFGLRRTAQPTPTQPTPTQPNPTQPSPTQPADQSDPETPNSFLPGWAENLLVSTTTGLPRPLRYTSGRERAIARRVRTVAQMLQIEHLLERLPKQLSGGQKQRVALGRAMARNPQVFLMDEPLSNLDAKLRAETRSQIVKLQRELGTTTIYVTHDQTEAMTMGDRIAVMNGGVIQQLATPLELYNRPANRFVAEFIGSPPMNFLPVIVNETNLTHPQFRLELGPDWEARLQGYQGQEVLLGIRPEHLQIGPPSEATLPLHVELVEALGSETFLQLSFAPDATPETGPETRARPEDVPLLQAKIAPDRVVKLGDRLDLAIALDQLHLFDAISGDAIR